MTIRTRSDFKTTEVDGKITDGSASITPTDHREVEKSAADSVPFLDESEIRVIDMTTAGPPATPSDRDAYVIAATATGAWTGLENQVALWDDGAGAWFVIDPPDGMAVWNLADDKEYRWDGAAWAERTTPASPGVTVNEQTGAAYTLAAADNGKVVERNNGSANTLTIDTQANAGYAVEFLCSIVQTGAGASTITAAAGVTLNGVDGGSATIDARWDGVSLYKAASDAWRLQGAHGGVA